MFDLDAYIERIGLQGRPTLHEIHRAHLASFPFENLDPHRGVEVSLLPEHLRRKMVEERRGGYCFEQNLLLKGALERMGMHAALFLARVRYGAGGTIRPRSHLVMRVQEAGSSWLADVGFGLRGLLDPIPFGPGEAHEQSGWSLRLVSDGGELVLQTIEGEEWVDLYGFVPHPVPMIDVEVSNWWVCTHPRSPFVTGLIVGLQREDGARISLSDWSELALVEQTPDGRSATPIGREEIPGVLSERFGLSGFALDPGGRVVLEEPLGEPLGESA